MNKSSWLLRRLQTGCFAILILCGLTYLVALWQSPPKDVPYQLFNDVSPGFIGYTSHSKMTLPLPTPSSAMYLAQHPFASRSAFAYTMVVFACIALMVVAALALGRILAERNRKAHGIIGWSAVMVGAWSLVLLTAGPFFVTCPNYGRLGITCSLASQSAAHWALGLLPLCALLTVLPAIAAFSALRLMAKPSASTPSMAQGLV